MNCMFYAVDIILSINAGLFKDGESLRLNTLYFCCLSSPCDTHECCRPYTRNAASSPLVNVNAKLCIFKLLHSDCIHITDQSRCHLKGHLLTLDTI